MKKVILSVACMVFLLTSCKNTQEQDKENEAQKTEQAENSADNAIINENLTTENAANAAVETIQANIDNAMSKVALPVFKKENATLMAKDFHKYLSELVNANSAQKADKYLDKLAELKKEYEKKVIKEKLDPGDKTALDKYVDDLLNAVQNAN